MRRDWKLGTVALVRWSRKPEGSIYIRADHGPVGHVWRGAGGWIGDSTAREVRPLVVIDYENREQVERLTRLFGLECANIKPGSVMADHMQAALREYADPKPRIEEPTDLAARVIDKDGDEWAMASGGYWACVSKRFHPPRTWDELLRDYGPVEVRQ